MGGAGIFRPEVVIPLLGEYIPVLAWGPGFDRSLMEYYGIKDIRELYENNLTKNLMKTSKLDSQQLNIHSLLSLLSYSLNLFTYKQ